MSRPEPYDNPNPDLFYYVATPDEDTLRWRLQAGCGPCRWTTGPGHRQCGQPGVAQLNRSHSDRPQWWAYCAEHMFGRWIEDGRIWRWRLVRKVDA